MEHDQIKVLEVVPSLSRAAGVARFAYNMALYHDEQRIHYDFLHHAIINGKMMHEKTYDTDLTQRGSKVYTVNYAGASFTRFVKEVGAFFAQHLSLIHI